LQLVHFLRDHGAGRTDMVRTSQFSASLLRVIFPGKKGDWIFF